MNKLICIGESIYSSVKEEYHQEEETAGLDLGVDNILQLKISRWLNVDL